MAALSYFQSILYLSFCLGHNNTLHLIFGCLSKYFRKWYLDKILAQIQLCCLIHLLIISDSFRAETKTRIHENVCFLGHQCELGVPNCKDCNFSKKIKHINWHRYLNIIWKVNFKFNILLIKCAIYIYTSYNIFYSRANFFIIKYDIL